MDISRQLPSEVTSLAGESEAVAILHRTLVNLREELIKRDNRIQILESKISNENLAQKGLFKIKFRYCSDTIFTDSFRQHGRCTQGGEVMSNTGPPKNR